MAIGRLEARVVWLPLQKHLPQLQLYPFFVQSGNTKSHYINTAIRSACRHRTDWIWFNEPDAVNILVQRDTVLFLREEMLFTSGIPATCTYFKNFMRNQRDKPCLFYFKLCHRDFLTRFTNEHIHPRRDGELNLGPEYLIFEQRKYGIDGCAPVDGVHARGGLSRPDRARMCLIRPDRARICLIRPLATAPANLWRGIHRDPRQRRTRVRARRLTLAPLGGYINPGEAALAAAKRELLEEMRMEARRCRGAHARVRGRRAKHVLGGLRRMP